MSSKMLSQKRSASEQSTSTCTNNNNNNDTTTTNNNNSSKGSTHCRYNRLLSILTKSLTQSRERIASDAPATIKESYGDMTSLFTSAEDSDGVKSLVDLLLGKLDCVHDRFTSEKLMASSTTSTTDKNNTTTNMTRLEQLLQQQNIQPTLLQLENAISIVTSTETQFIQQEETDKQSAKEAIKLAKYCATTYISPTTHKKRRILPAESIGYHAHALKVEYRMELQKELEEVANENEVLENELKDGWKGWQEGVEGIKVALGVLDELGE